MSKMTMGHVAGISLALLLGAAALAEAQVEKGRPGVAVPPITGRQPAAEQQPAGPAGAGVTTQVPVNMLLPCCVVEGFENSLKVGSLKETILVLKDTKTGAKQRVRLAGKAGSSSNSARFRPGQTVDMNIHKTRLAITPFPVEESTSDKINGNSSWKMWTDVTVSNNGRIDGKTRTKSSEAARGFTGGVEVLLTDRAGNILHQTQLRTYGVNGTAMGGKSERTETWNETVPAEALNKVRLVAIKHSYEPKNRFAASLGWIRDNADNISTLMECTAKYLGEDEEEAPPAGGGNGASQSQPSASDPTALECVEAGEELAEELGF